MQFKCRLKVLAIGWLTESATGPIGNIGNMLEDTLKKIQKNIAG